MSEFAKADVVVVGAGPAGSAAAIFCAQNGLDVIIVERKQFPRDHAGETVHPGIEPLLKQLGVLDKVMDASFLRYIGNWVKWDHEKHFLSFDKNGAGSWKGFQLWRADFDAILLNHAQELGVKIIQPCQVYKPIINKSRDNKVKGILTSKGVIYSSYVIDAAGSQQWLSKQLNIEIRKYSPPLIVNYGYVEEKYPFCENIPSITADRDGWTWIAKVRSSLIQWTRLFFSIDSMKRDFIPEEIQGMRKKGLTHSADVTWRIATKPSGQGYFIVGDAAFVLDPSSSHGILKAIMSGIMSGYLITKIKNNGELENIAIIEYFRWIMNWFKHDINKLKEFYLKLPFPPAWII
jgi:flavin-dependent dehydrogenase